MAASVADFKVLYPEFRATGDAQLTAALAQAETRVASDWEPTQRDEVVYLELAAALADSPGGRRAQKTEDTSGDTTYEKRLTALKQARALTRRVM